MAVITSASDSGYTLRIEGRFDLLIYDDFLAAFSNLTTDSTQITVDLSQTEYLDSSALGMLLMLREHFDSTAEILLFDPQPHVARILAIANFDKLFSVECDSVTVSGNLSSDGNLQHATRRQPQSESR